MSHIPGLAYLPKGTTIVIGVVGEHDSPEVQDLLDILTGYLMAYPWMPLLPSKIHGDCFVAPPERGSVHVDTVWIQV